MLFFDCGCNITRVRHRTTIIRPTFWDGRGGSHLLKLFSIIDRMIAHHFLFNNSLRLCDGMIINWEAFIDNFTDVNGYIMKEENKRDRFITPVALLDALIGEEPDVKLVRNNGVWKVTNKEVERQWAKLKTKLDSICQAYRDEAMDFFSKYKGLEDLRLILGERKPVGSLETLDIERQENSDYRETLRLTGKTLKLVKKCIVQIDEDMVELKHYGHSLHVEYLFKMKEMYAEKFFSVFTKVKASVELAATTSRPVFLMTEAEDGLLGRVLAKYLQEGHWIVVLKTGAILVRTESVQGWLVMIENDHTFNVPDSLLCIANAQRQISSISRFLNFVNLHAKR